eukprot:TRINITY_DN780_c1_g1_i1.p1 TRINITY_DN780_c1_g1~~TRINITY_DN780_c1_g1_i1.p1  ORF type:complete len:177 (-),score=67.58 TRINITY_DN780_c1_g1_i1:160-690(-)
MGMYEYVVLGRQKPSKKNPYPKIYRMRLFAKNEVVAKSRFWSFLSKMHRIKRPNGELLAIHKIFEKKPTLIKNYGVLLRYDSHSGTHNLYKEFRDVTRYGAINQLYCDMASRHRARPDKIQIIHIKKVSAKKVKRPNTKQFINSKIRFPLPHRIFRASLKRLRTRFLPIRPTTHWQ